MHSIHGRAPAIATGNATTRPDLSVRVLTGDGDAQSIGGNHFMHIIRRNVDVKILMFNNRIYGLTKGQYSPTSETGKITKSTPVGSIDHPFNPVSLALGAEATFVARTIDSDRTHLTSVLTAAATHRGTALVEIYQNCPIFNDGAYAALKDNDTRADALIPLEHGQPIRFGAQHQYGITPAAGGGVEITDLTTNPDREPDLIIHDEHNPDPSLAFALSRLTDTGTIHHAPIGIFRNTNRPTYDDQARTQITTATKNLHNPTTALTNLINNGDTWTVL
jgi:2-oxoglutarate ferredoxin oxidoreductase subunit beta